MGNSDDYGEPGRLVFIVSAICHAGEGQTLHIKYENFAPNAAGFLLICRDKLGRYLKNRLTSGSKAILTLHADKELMDHSPLNPVQQEAQDDAALMRLVAAGDQRAFQRLMHRHLSRTVRLASRILGGSGAAEDAAQEAFIRVWKHAADWEDPGKTGAKFTTWLYRIVLNLCIDEKRKHRFTNIDDVAEPEDETPNAERGLERQEQSARVKDALAELPDRQRAAFVLCFYEDYSNKEAADMLGISVKAVESLLVRSRRILRDKLVEEKP